MNINEAKALLHKYNDSTKKQYEKTMESALKAVNSTNLYDVYNNIDIVYEKMKGGSPGYVAGYFAHLKRIMENMNSEQKNHIKIECIEQLGNYTNKNFHLKKEVDDNDSDGTYEHEDHDKLLMEHRIHELKAELETFQQRFELMENKMVLLQDLVMQLLIAPDRTHALQNIAVMALDKINKSMETQHR
jgi:hypothetical protein